MPRLYPVTLDGTPTGALGFGLFDRGEPHGMSAELTPYPDGPYLLRGDFALTDPDGNEIDPHRRTIALCRCGASRRKPFCDGTHKLIGFRAPAGETVALRLVTVTNGKAPS